MNSDLADARMSLHLLDASDGRTIQTWKFEKQHLVRIGRASETEVTLADSVVSRIHAELRFDGERWSLVSHGRNGTLVNDQRVTEIRIRDGMTFQLGFNGPTFKFATVDFADSPGATVDSFDPVSLDFLEVDEKQTSEEVRQITDTDAFRDLQERAKELRRGSAGSDLDD